MNDLQGLFQKKASDLDEVLVIISEEIETTLNSILEEYEEVFLKGKAEILPLECLLYNIDCFRGALRDLHKYQEELRAYEGPIELRRKRELTEEVTEVKEEKKNFEVRWKGALL